jgi:preprotein translocase subunit SecF
MGAVALLVTAVGIVLYLWLRFEWRFGVSGIIANLHDVVIILGCFAFFQWEFSLPVLAAVLACWATRSTNRSSCSTACGRTSARCARRRPRSHRLGDHRRNLAHDHHALVHADDGDDDAALRRPRAALLRGRADDRHLLRYLFVVLVASPLVMWLGVDRSQFVRPQKKDRRDEHEGAVV